MILKVDQGLKKEAAMKCDCGKKLLAAVAVFLFKMITGVVLCGGIFSWV